MPCFADPIFEYHALYLLRWMSSIFVLSGWNEAASSYVLSFPVIFLSDFFGRLLVRKDVCALQPPLNLSFHVSAGTYTGQNNPRAAEAPLRVPQTHPLSLGIPGSMPMACQERFLCAQTPDICNFRTWISDQQRN